jgi:NADH-quinone oxidoreductase subunit N
MTASDLIPLFPLIVLAVSPAVIMLAVAFYRNYLLSLLLTLAGILIAFFSLFSIPDTPRHVTSLLVIDDFALFYMGLIFAASFVVALFSSDYLRMRRGNPEEFYILLLLATLGSAVLVASDHFASFFVGLEILSVSLYALIGYTRNDLNIEAGVKYLVLAAASAAFLLFGIALLYAETGTMEFSLVGPGMVSEGASGRLLLTGLAMIIVGTGFKLAVAPFHMWTPDVYEGAPAPVTAFIATVSKGAMFALLLRYFLNVDIHAYGTLFAAVAFIAVISMFTGNLLALLQDNVKRTLAYSSIAHLGYLLVAFLAGGPLRVTAVTLYLAAYFITTLGAFGVVTVLSGKERDADALDDYRGLFSTRPWLALIFSAMLFSLAGIPLTAGFMGKFYVVAAGAGSDLWLLVIALVINSAIGLFYYLRIIVVMFAYHDWEKTYSARSLPVTGGVVLVVLAVLLIWLGVYPMPLIEMIHSMTGGI